MSDVSNTSELIEKAREATACRCVDAPEIECGNHGDDHSRMVADLADALEAATRVPVQGEPTLSCAVNHVGGVCPGYPHTEASVPDAATERYEKAEHARLYWRRRYQSMHKRAKGAETERDAALGRIAELERSYRIIERLYKIERQERIEAEARIAEAAKLHTMRPNSASAMYPVSLCKCGAEYPCGPRRALGLNEGENDE